MGAPSWLVYFRSRVKKSLVYPLVFVVSTPMVTVLGFMLGAFGTPEAGGIAGSRWLSFHLFPFLKLGNLGK
jgi:hypothetical protein